VGVEVGVDVGVDPGDDVDGLVGAPPPPPLHDVSASAPHRMRLGIAKRFDIVTYQRAEKD
jgi:hypothetical protein